MSLVPNPKRLKLPEKLPATILFISGVLFSVLAFQLYDYFNPPVINPNRPRSYKIERVGGLKNIGPVLGVRRARECPEYIALKDQITSYIASLTARGELSSASVYLREFDHGDWISINPESDYHPASLMKVALMICYLHMAERTPGLLEKELLFTAPESGKITTQYYKDLSIEPGKKYTIQQLLTYMIVYSDNNATWVLSQYFDPKMLYKLFADMGLQPPVQDEEKFTLNVHEYSKLIEIIYNASFLSPEYSDYAAELMRHCSFNEGFAKGIGSERDSMMWHKFGEWRFPGHDAELHESGIIHVKGKPYLLTIMTKGKNTDQLANTISKISQTIYESLATP